MRPQANTPVSLGTRTSPVSASTRTSANCAPNECRATGGPSSSSSAVSTATSVSPARSARQALTTAAPQDEVPIDPPATIAWPKELSPISTCTRSGGTSSSSAAIWVSTVRAPVPMSAAAMRMVKLPSSSARPVAVDGMRRAG